MLRRIGIAVLLGVCAAPDLFAANRYDPRLRFRTLRTVRFDIHFHQREERLARRLAGIAETVADRVARQIGKPNGRVHVILVDQNDLSNGWANPFPYNVIEITVAGPPGSSSIGYTDDWLTLVFAHEYTHIVHLDKARGWIGGLRHVFGHAPLLYPNAFLPLWQIEGIATYNESVLTGEGRVRTGDFRFILEGAASAGRFEPLDRVNGGLVDWPTGAAHYAYGAYFHQYLADKFGAASIGRLTEDTSGRVPYLGTRAFKKVFGRSLGDLWKDFAADTVRRQQPSSRTQLTHHGFNVTAPAFSASGRLFYAVTNPHGFPSLMELRPQDTRPRRVAEKFLGDRIAASGSLLVFDQIELERDVALRSDLYAVDQNGGSVRRLTKNARAADPDVSPDGRAIVCTVQSTDGRALATMPMAPAGTISTPATLVAEDGTDFTGPRWSPDGRSIAAERRRRGAASEIVVVDVATRAVRTLAASRDGRNVTPYWTPDGRAIIFASDRGGEPFAIYSAALADGSLRRLQGAGISAQSPIVSPDGRDLVFVGYTTAGYDLFSLPLASATWSEVAATPAAPAAQPAGLKASTTDSAPVAQAKPSTTEADTPYRPWRTLLPRFWIPILDSNDGEFSAGAGTAGGDALGRHAYDAAATWTIPRGRPDWSVSYAYDRWRPTFFVAASDDTDPWLDGDVRTREFTAGALYAVRRVRWTSAALLAFDASTDDFACALCPRPLAGIVTRRALHLGWLFNNARAYGYSISPESGTALRTTVESAPAAFGSDATTGAFVADARGYVPVGARHAVLALRGAGASSWGDSRRRRVFSASGPGPQFNNFDVGTDAIGLLRGFDEASVVGERAVVANLDLRFPIRYVQRGFGTLPFFLQTIHGSVFADTANAWTDRFDAADLRRSFGAELSLDTVLGYVVPVTFTGGIAWRHDPVEADRGWAVFGRIGRAF